MLRLRDPRWMFGLVALLVFAVVALACAIALIAGVSGMAAPQAQILMWPAMIATIIAGGAIGPKLRRREINRRREVVLRAGVAGLAAGLAWPLSFSASIFAAEGAGALVEGLGPVAIGAAIGLISGAAGGAAASLAAMVKD